MSLTLTANIGADDTLIRVTGTVPDDLDSGSSFRIGDELMTFQRFEPKRTTIGNLTVEIPFAKVPSRNVWLVSRGQSGSTKASHTAGASLVGAAGAWVSSSSPTPPDPFADSGGGGVTVTGSQGGGPFTATAVKLAGVATDLGGGTAGQGLVTQQFGPYAIAYDTPNLWNADNSPAGVILDTLPAGVILASSVVDTSDTWSVDDSGGRFCTLELDGGSGAGSVLALPEFWVDDDNGGNYPGTAGGRAFPKVDAPGDPVPLILFVPMDLKATVLNVTTPASAPSSGHANVYVLMAVAAS